MEKSEEINFDSDLDDDETDRTKNSTLPRLSFERKLTVHRNNRLNEISDQINIPLQSNKDILIPIQNQTSNHTERIRMYEKNCHMLDRTIDWQIRALLAGDKITIVNRALSFNDIYAFTNVLEINLECLTLSSVGLSTSSLNILCEGLRKCVHINLLDLSYNKISKEGFELLIDTLKHLSSLLYLSLSNCGIQDSYGRKQIDYLCRHKRIKELNLSGNELEELSCILIGNGLTENINLIYLNLSWNFIRSFASIALFRGFEINKTLTEFDISWNRLSYDGSVALRRVLFVNKVLQRLNISNCNIDWTCAKLISEGLAKNSTLNMLNLSSNPLTTHGIDYIVQALNTKKSTLSVLDISVGF